MSDFSSYITWDKFIDVNHDIPDGDGWEETNILCPECWKPIRKFVGVALTTFPVTYRYECKECGWSGLTLSNWMNELPSAEPEIIRCKDCKHFEYDHPFIIQGIPVLGHEVCNAWGNGCKTDKNGYCFMAERKTDE